MYIRPYRTPRKKPEPGYEFNGSVLLMVMGIHVYFMKIFFYIYLFILKMKNRIMSIV